MNSVNLVGRVGWVSATQASVDGEVSLRLRVATDDSFLSRTGERVTRTNWHTVKVFGRAADALAKKLTVGALVSVQARLVTWSAESSAGTTERVELEAFRVRVLGPARGEAMKEEL